MALELDSDIFGSVPEVKEGVNQVQGLPESFLVEIYQGVIPEAYTRQDIIEQTAAFIESRLTAVGYCVIRDMPNWVYHALGYISSTLLKGYAKNPRTCRKPYKAGDHANVGSGIHAFTLQGQEGFDAECAIMPIECEGRSKKADLARDEFARENPGKVPLPYRYGKDEEGDKPYVMDVLRGVDASYREHEIIGPMLANSEKELSLFWVDEKSGCRCMARLDILCGTVIGDAKKCRDLDGFQWQLEALFYYMQIGHYTNGARACGLLITGAALLPCEAFHPYRVEFWPFDESDLDYACSEAERYVSLVKDSVATGIWPNYQIPYYSQKLSRAIWSLSDISPEDLQRNFKLRARNNY